MSDTLFTSTAAFRRHFEDGLSRLLEAGGLNLFVLVAANATYDAALFAALRGRLEAAYGDLLSRYRTALTAGRRVEAADDDLLVFLKIAAIGFDALATRELRQAGPWEVQFNHLRAFRPMRNSQRPIARIRQPFDNAAFNFNRPFMQQEALWSGRLLGQPVDLYYNKYPFVDSHCLLVPARERGLEQYHLRDMHELVWRLVDELAGALPGVRVGYNALGAFASVNHLHFQLFVRTGALPVENAGWKHNGGGRDYPVVCCRFEDCAAAWSAIEHLQAQNQAYNLLYTPQAMYCMVREKQGGFMLPEWSAGLSWYELCGGMLTFNRDDFATLDSALIDAALTRARCAMSAETAALC